MDVHGEEKKGGVSVEACKSRDGRALNCPGAGKQLDAAPCPRPVTGVVISSRAPIKRCFCAVGAIVAPNEKTSGPRLNPDGVGCGELSGALQVVGGFPCCQECALPN